MLGFVHRPPASSSQAVHHLFDLVGTHHHVRGEVGLREHVDAAGNFIYVLNAQLRFIILVQSKDAQAYAGTFVHHLAESALELRIGGHKLLDSLLGRVHGLFILGRILGTVVLLLRH